MAAKPDCDDGWLKYAHELDAALAVADFTKGARIVLREVFSQIFGPAKLRHAKLSPAEIGGRVGMARSHVMRGITELVDSGVLARSADGFYKFIKDYESWTYKGARRLSEAEVVYCHSAPKIALSYMYTPTQNALPDEVTHQQLPVTSLGNNGEAPLPNEVTDVTQRGNGMLPNEVTDSLDSSSPPDPPCEDGCAEFETMRIETIPPPPPEGDDDEDPAMLPDPGTPDVKKPNLPLMPDPAIVAELEDLSRIVLGDRGEWGSFYTHVRGWLVSFPADWVRNAIYCLGANPKVKPDGLAFYALKCFRNWNAHGLGEKDARDIEAGRRKFAPAASPAADDYKPMTAEDIEFEKVLREGERRRAEKIALEKGKKSR